MQRLDQDGVGEFLADAEAGVADLADEIGLAAEKFDDLFFAETDFAQAHANFRSGGQLPDANDGAGFNFAEWTNARTGALAVEEDVRLCSFVHRSQRSGIGNGLQGWF